MILPAFLLGTTLTFWGWYTGLWWLGLPLGILSEAPRYLDWHWELDTRERQRVADLSTILILLAGGFLYLTQARFGAVFILLVQWSPALLFPLLVMQIYGGLDGVERSVLFWSLRKGGGEDRVDLRPTYWLLCLLATAMTPPEGYRYYLVLALLTAWTLYAVRPPGARIWRWSLVLGVAIPLGYALSLSLQHTQQLLEDQVIEWISGWLVESDPYRVNTAIGEVGNLKLSERIVLRVRPAPPLQLPLLLRSASYNAYFDGTWTAGGRGDFQALSTEMRDWQLPGSEIAQPRHAVVVLELNNGRGLLPLPGGTRRIRGLEGANLSRHPTLGTVKVTDGPALARYRLEYGGALAEEPPLDADLRVSPKERPALEALVTELGLRDLPAPTAVASVANLFAQNFHYSLKLTAPPGGRSALEHFLVYHRAGHCEYFASAAVLLLRQAGIPARYARGWSIQEYSDLEQAYVARARHAHAWALVWVNGAWQDFDPTPANWGALEAEQRPWWGYLQDLWLRTRFLLAGGDREDEDDATWMGLLLVPLVLLLGWRIARHGRRRRIAATKLPVITEADGWFTPIEQLFANRGHARQRTETLRQWLHRLVQEGEMAAVELVRLLDPYYRLRFDPHGLDTQTAQHLQMQLQTWLQRATRQITAHGSTDSGDPGQRRG